jgi:hypothetical protein
MVPMVMEDLDQVSFELALAVVKLDQAVKFEGNEVDHHPSAVSGTLVELLSNFYYENPKIQEKVILVSCTQTYITLYSPLTCIFINYKAKYKSIACCFNTPNIELSE